LLQALKKLERHKGLHHVSYTMANPDVAGSNTTSTAAIRGQIKVKTGT